jgi:hypothetical protein
VTGNVEHEGFLPEETEVVDIFAPPGKSWNQTHPQGGAGWP